MVFTTTRPGPQIELGFGGVVGMVVIIHVILCGGIMVNSSQPETETMTGHGTTVLRSMAGLGGGMGAGAMPI